MPITFFEGIRETERTDIRLRNMERRFYALAAAVREHEGSVRRADPGVAEKDEGLYRRLRQLSGEPATSEHGVA
ncbi:MAG: hypothetical protein JJE23_06745 [Thermoleophilia bacterium]|jgi:hypothetical protein|nr:hypothetical protein [Thermoleophilia bacterium]TFG72407.1 MAG: hypothetical protein E4H22_02725 [Solirubrobacterales bacterium]